MQSVNADAAAPHATGTVDRAALSIANIAAKYGLDENFFLGSVLYHLLETGTGKDVRDHLQRAAYFVKAEIVRGGAEPVSSEDALAWAPPEVIARAYMTTGNVEAAITQVLHICAYALDDETDEETGETSSPLEVLQDLIALAIDELTATGA